MPFGGLPLCPRCTRFCFVWRVKPGRSKAVEDVEQVSLAAESQPFSFRQDLQRAAQFVWRIGVQEQAQDDDLDSTFCHTMSIAEDIAAELPESR